MLCIYSLPKQTACTVSLGDISGRTQRPHDNKRSGRKVLITAIERGADLVEKLLTLHGQWLRRVITEELDDHEQHTLAIAVALMNRLAAA